MEFLSFQPFLALVLIAISCSLLGVFVLWKKLAYFGDASSHSVLLGLALGFSLQIQQNYALISFAIIFAIFVFFITKNRYFSKDTLIAIASYFCISGAILINDFSPDKIDFESYIFGDIFSIETLDLYILTTIALITILFTIFNFKKLLFVNLNQDLARIGGLKVDFLNAFFIVLLSVIIALSVKIVGVLLMTALLVLPAAIARLFSSSAKQMIFASLVISLLNCIFCANLANYYQLSLGALTIFVFCIIFIIANLFKNAK